MSNNYEALFDSFVNGGGLKNNNFDDGFDDGDFNDEDFNGGARGVKKPKAKKSPKQKDVKVKKANKKVKDDEKVVEVDVFTVIQSSVNVTGSTYKSRTPRSAALKAAGALFKSRPSARTLTFTMQKITPNSNKRVYAYQATLEIFSKPEIVIKHDKDGKELRIPITRKVNIKKIEVDEDIRREQKEALKVERKERREKEKAKAKKAERAEMRAKGEKMPKADKKPKAKKEKVDKKPKAKKEKVDKDMLKALKKAEKEEKKLLEKADKLLTKYSKSMEENKKPKKPKAQKKPKADKKPKAEKKPKADKKPKGKGKKNAFWGGIGCGSNYCN